MNRIVEFITALLPKKSAPPKPWEDPKRSQADREAWIKAEPKSLQKNRAA